MYPCEHCGLPRDGKDRCDNSESACHKCIPELKAYVEQLKTERNYWQSKWTEVETERVNFRAEVEQLRKFERLRKLLWRSAVWDWQYGDVATSIDTKQILEDMDEFVRKPGPTEE